MRKIRDKDGNVHDVGTLENTLNLADDTPIGVAYVRPVMCEWKGEVFRSIVARMDAEKEFHNLITKLFGDSILNYVEVFKSPFGQQLFGSIEFTEKEGTLKGVVTLGKLRELKNLF